MISALVGHYRCPDDFLQLELKGPLSPDPGYFRFGNNAICYGRSSTGYRTPKPDALLYNALDDLRITGAKVLLPFDPTEIITNLRMERYARHGRPTDWSWRQRFLRDTYYYLRPRMGVGVRKYLQRLYASRWRHLAFPHWPVDTSVEQLNEALLLASMRAQGLDRMPFVWFWPDGARSCLLMTHDVESRVGYDFCGKLMDIDDAHNIKACFQLVPEGTYRLRDEILQDIRERGFEANIQDLNHDGYLFADREEFLRRAKKINEYGRAYEAKGFRAAVLYRNPDWYDALEFSYDMSIPNVAHLDPQRGGCCTVMPYFIGNVLEIPLTTTQDYMLFHVLGEYSLDLWKAQAEAILKHNGLISFLVHPDYVIEKRAQGVYRELLSWVRELVTRERLWSALPGQVDDWWRARSKMRVVQAGGEWRVEGPGADRAVLAFAKIVGDHIEYEVNPKLKLIDCQRGGGMPGLAQ